MLPSRGLVVFNARVILALAVNDDDIYRGELEALRVAFKGRRFQILITPNIIGEYQAAAGETLSLQLQPALDQHLRQGRAVFKPFGQMTNLPHDLAEFPKEHIDLVHDAIAGGADYLVTRRQRWLDLAGHTEDRYGLKIVLPSRFVEQEG